MSELPERTGKMIRAVALMTREEALAAGWPEPFWQTAVRLMGADWRVASQIIDTTGARVAAVDEDGIELVAHVRDWDPEQAVETTRSVPVRIHVSRGATPEQLARLEGPPPDDSPTLTGSFTQTTANLGGWPAGNLFAGNEAQGTRVPEPVVRHLQAVRDE